MDCAAKVAYFFRLIGIVGIKNDINISNRQAASGLSESD